VIHTLKGNCAMFGLERYSELCHAVEAELADAPDAGLDADQRARLVTAWTAAARTMTRLLGERPREVVEVAPEERARVLHLARTGAPARELASVLATWSDEPAARRFERLGQHAVGLSRRLGRGEVEIEVAANGVRLDPARFASLWNALVHVVRNAVDHGFEGRPTPHRLEFRATKTADEIVLELADNGRGIDWESIRVRARERGLPCATHDDLVEALFGDGITTREAATSISGRGVGLAALRASVASLGGSIAVASVPDRGTTFSFRVPQREPALHREAV
jgi:two-component system chemotaxis sensor kinase CheA